MKISFFIILTLFLTILQTTAFPDFFLYYHSFDLLIIIILYLSLNFTHPGIICVIMLIGCTVDSISGVHFGLYLTTYIWIYVIVQALKQFVFARNILFYIGIAVMAVAIESLFFILSVLINQGGDGVLSLNYYLMAKQMIIALIVIPIALEIILIVQKKYEVIIINVTGTIKNKLDYSN